MILTSLYQVKRSVRDMKEQVTTDIWEMTTDMDVLKEDDWKASVETTMKDFEMRLLKAMRYYILSRIVNKSVNQLST